MPHVGFTCLETQIIRMTPTSPNELITEGEEIEINE